MALSFSNVKTLKPIRGLREAIIDITLDENYAAGGWAITAANLTNYSGIGSIIYDLQPGKVNGYGFEWDTTNGKLKALVGAADQEVTVDALAEYTMVPAYTGTEQAAALCKVYNSTAAAYENLADSADLGDDVTNDYQPWPDAADEAIGDMVYFGGAVPFGQIAFTITTGAVYGAADSVGWEYYNADGSWDSLTSAIIYDGSGSNATDGTYSFEQTGTMTIVPPQDWGSSDVDGQTAYWIRAKLLKAQVTTTSVFTSEHDFNIPDTGYVAARTGVINGVSLLDTSDTPHSANDIEFYVINTTNGESSGVCAFPQDITTYDFAFPHSVRVSAGDKLAIVCTQEDETNELDSGFWTFHYGEAEALAGDGSLAGQVVRCRVLGS